MASNGDYTFRLDSDDGSRLFVNGDKVVEVEGLGGMGRVREGRVLLEKGVSKIRVEYFQYGGDKGIAILLRKNAKVQIPFTKKKVSGRAKNPPIMLVAQDEARIYRNYIKGTTPRAIGVGYPEQVNLAFSADELGIGEVWIGDFIDAGRHWTGRGQGSQPPAGQRVVKLGKGACFCIDAWGVISVAQGVAA